MNKDKEKERARKKYLLQQKNFRKGGKNNGIIRCYIFFELHIEMVVSILNFIVVLKFEINTFGEIFDLILT